MSYVPPEIRSLIPTDQQAFILEQVREQANELIGRPGRGSGQSTLRAMIAQAIIDDHTPYDGGYESYRVVPVGNP